ncbi:hypothetical protein BDV95DRAFT_616229 [Massariosphaeria phaeospora]|uniref:Beta-lactamase-like protein n=1 Tax=Massariosphaeria phaeospora TaxID=100035 RepID=A0A7C8MCR1_9PLEO|nr:hypothetical protein BDV95DRAFT_616229 [Massariosphaeria phaeospora]
MKFSSGDLAICMTCGNQYDVPYTSPPASCRICDASNPHDDPRQYVPAGGQSWTSLAREQNQQKNTISQDPSDPRIHFISTTPKVAGTLPAGLSDSTTTRKQLGIGQRCILLQTPAGNVLWDLIAFIDDATVETIKSKGGLKAIVISHPHFYTTHLEWARIFQCPVYVSSDDAEWMNREDREGVRALIKGIEEIVPGEKKLFIADTMMSVPSGFYHKDRLPGTTSFSFMWSYPNMIPLPPAKVHRIWQALKPFAFETTYGGFPGQDVTRSDLKAQVLESMKIFLRTAGHENAEIFRETL